MSRPSYRLVWERRASASLEFAFVALPFMLVMFSIIAGGMLLWAKNAVQLTATQTARCVAIGSLDCVDPTAYAKALLSTWGVSSALPAISVTVTTGATCGTSVGHYVAVTITGASGALGQMVPGLAGTDLVANACYPTGA